MRFLLVFDMDGTLIDSERSITRCLEESAGKLGYGLSDVSRYIGVLKLTQILVRSGVKEADLPLIMRQYVDCYLNTFELDTKPIVNSPTVLRELQKDNDLGILTLKNKGLTEEIVKRFFPGVHFKYIVGGDLPIENKVEGLKYILAESGRKPDQVYYIGDRASDVRSAMDAGTMAVWVSFGLGKKSDFDFEGDYEVANSFDDLLDLFSSRT
ncbi:MAG: HAD family hydrolase [Candidatus Thermoplasmatota archaeon]|jgi:phosphoglycolate phosphatase-like HAD superfamily hydrolase|nr:HAD family hydrolase [Candidatus Thermoplasmatota archaeon]MCL5789755.1 HAD family hydrolase [Candidatus Thermoplasmatota archaeon]